MTANEESRVLAGGAVVSYSGSMVFRGRVVDGRIVIDQPTDLPEGTVLDLTIAEHDEMDAEEKARLEAALERSWAQVEAGKTRPASELLRELRSK